MTTHMKIPTPPDGHYRDAELVPVNRSNEPGNTYELADGTVVSVKTVVTQVWRVEGQFDAEGNPVYVVKHGNFVTVTAPEQLRRKPS